MSIEQMRDYVSRLSESRAWKERVRGMSNNQILAIYNRSVLDRSKAKDAKCNVTNTVTNNVTVTQSNADR